MTYKIVRFFSDNRKKRVLVKGVTLEIAQAFCSGPWSKGKLKRSGVEWAYEFEKEQE